MAIHRRDFLIGASSLPWMLGARLSLANAETRVRHLLPVVSQHEILIQMSLNPGTSSTTPPVLTVNGQNAVAEMIGHDGRYFRFYAHDLAPATSHSLMLSDHAGQLLLEPWTLRTLPAEDEDINHFRLATFTCAGGHEDTVIGGRPMYLSLATRHRLLKRMLDFEPDAVVANGDHIYRDQQSWFESPNPRLRQIAESLKDRAPAIDRRAAPWAGVNAAILEATGDSQIADVYGTLFKSVPVWFVNDDHDYFENDEANDAYATFPPAPWQYESTSYLQRRFLPPMPASSSRPDYLPGSIRHGALTGWSHHFGTIRAGRLLEACLYDCSGFLSLKGNAAGLIPGVAEEWLNETAKRDATRHLLHIPSHPPGWTAGKWREWYPDLGPQRDKTDSKYLWQPGWWQQHQRLLSSLSRQRDRIALIVSGDLHASGHSLITRSGELDFSNNPVHTILPGTLGTNGGWPSASRGMAPQTPDALRVEPLNEIQEKNGFTLLDFTPETVRVRCFTWRSTQPASEIDTLKPTHDLTIQRGKL